MTDVSDPGWVRTVAAVIRDRHGRVLLVRKRGSVFFIQPGGKREPGEAPLATLSRELSEELGVALRGSGAVRLGEFEQVAVNEPGCRVHAEVFLVEIDGEPSARAEIEELAWVSPGGPHTIQVAPLSEACILPVVAHLSPVGDGGER